MRIIAYWGAVLETPVWLHSLPVPCSQRGATAALFSKSFRKVYDDNNNDHQGKGGSWDPLNHGTL